MASSGFFSPALGLILVMKNINIGVSFTANMSSYFIALVIILVMNQI